MYQTKLTIKDTQKAIKIVKDDFENRLAKSLNLDRVSAPILVLKDGVNDDLGIENSALSFYLEALDEHAEIVQSLAKWKRMALKKYGYHLYEGIYTDMNAIRQKETLDQLHSLYVDQWDWELIIDEKDQNEAFLKSIVRKILRLLKETKDKIKTIYPVLTDEINEEIHFITSEELYFLYPNLDSKAREREITRQFKSVFLMKIGVNFANGLRHDLRAADYDNWNLNGDILIWSETLNDVVEVSSMGIRVNKETLTQQLKDSNQMDKVNQTYHQMILNNELPYTIGGGIGQSRICMILLEKYHIAEVQASIWDSNSKKFFKEHKLNIL